MDDFETFLRESGQLSDASTDDGWMAMQDECDTKMFAMEAERIDKEKTRAGRQWDGETTLAEDAGLDEQADIELEKEAFLLDGKRAASLPYDVQLLQMESEARLRSPVHGMQPQYGMPQGGARPMTGQPMMGRAPVAGTSPQQHLAQQRVQGNLRTDSALQFGSFGGEPEPAPGPEPEPEPEPGPELEPAPAQEPEEAGRRRVGDAREDAELQLALELSMRESFAVYGGPTGCLAHLKSTRHGNPDNTKGLQQRCMAKPPEREPEPDALDELCKIVGAAADHSMNEAQATGKLYAVIPTARRKIKLAGGLAKFCEASGRLKHTGKTIVLQSAPLRVVPGQPAPTRPPSGQTGKSSTSSPAKSAAPAKPGAQRSPEQHQSRPAPSKQPRASAPRGNRPEMRVDPADGEHYMHREFREAYGRTPQWPQQWNKAEVFDVELFKQTISKFADQLRAKWAAANENVSFNRVMEGIRTQYKVRQYEELKAGPFWEIDALRKLQALDDKITGVILAYIKVRSIGTLHDLEEHIVTEEEVSSFGKLRIGPLLKHPLVKQHFQPAAGVTVIPVVTVLDVVGQLQTMMKRPRSRAAQAKRFEGEDVLTELAAQRELRGPLDLCCRIARHGLGMYIPLISKVQMGEKNKLGNLRVELEKDSMKAVAVAKIALEKLMKEDTQSDETLNRSWHEKVEAFAKHFAAIALENDSTDGHLAKLVENLFRDGKVTDSRVRVKLVDFKRLSAVCAAYITLRSSGDMSSHDLTAELGMNPDDIVVSIEASAQSVFSEIAETDAPEDAHTAASLLWRVEMATCADLGLLRFEALHQGSFLSFLQDQQLGRRWAPFRLGGSDLDDEMIAHDVELTSAAVPLDELTAALETMLRQAGDAEEDFDFEETICARFGARSFTGLGHGTTLQFLSANTNIALLLALWKGWTSVDVASGVVEDFVRQAVRHGESCGQALSPEGLEASVSSYFKASLAQLGQPCAALLLQQSKASTSATSGILYWGARSPMTQQPEQPADNSVGVLGWVDPEQVVAAIQCTPILTSLEQHLLWDVTFAASHGTLENFLSVHKTPGCTILEIETNLHVRIFDSSSAKDFRECCCTEDATEAVAHLVSIYVRTGLAQKDLLALTCSQALQQLGGGGTDRPVSFILCCLEAMPTTSVREALAPILLEPMKEVTADFAGRMLKLCKDRTILHRLGFTHGVDVWVEDFKGNLQRKSATSAPGVQGRDVSDGIQSDKDVSDGLQSDADAAETTGRVTEEPELEEASPELEQSKDRPADEDELSPDVKPKPSSAGISVGAEDCSNACAVIEAISQDPDLKGDRLMRAMEKISVELYSEKQHFVMELIQNADDNSYPASCDVPAVEFVLSPQGMLIKNNEIGFAEANVRALCDVGGSTKGGGGSGFIGQKGIGFKSVFSVTNEPAIRSRGYSFCFKNYETESHKKNMLMPHWLGDDHKWSFDDSSFDDDDDEEDEFDWTTTIMLPFNSHDIDISKFDSIQPSLLLFLNKLRAITVTSGIEQRVMQRFDRKDNIVEISHTGGNDVYLVTSKELQIDAIRRSEKATATRLECAFPLEGHQSQRPVYAFLPVASYGLRFIIQGDFIVSSSREAIVEDSPWNQWLRDEIADLFVDSLQQFKQGGASDDAHVPNIDAFYRFIPLDGEVRGFFASTVSEIRGKLRASPCILSEGGDWAMPSMCLLAGPQVRRLISEQQLMDALEMKFVDESIDMNPALAQHLGVETFGTTHLCLFIQEAASQLDEQLSPEEYVKFVAQALYLLYQLDDQTQMQHKVAWKKKLSQLKFIPLVDGSRGRLEDRLFFPASNLPGSLQAVHAVFQHELPIVDDDLCSMLGETLNPVVRKQLSEIGVKPLSRQMIVTHHIVPMLQSDAESVQSKERAILSAYWGFLRAYHAMLDKKKQAELCDDLRDCALLPCVSLHPGQHEASLQLGNAQDLHFSSHFASKLKTLKLWPKFELEESLSGAWKFVDPRLLDDTATRAADWQPLLDALGVAHFAAIKRVRKTLSLPDGNKTVSYDDWCSDELDELIRIVTRDGAQDGDGFKGDQAMIRRLTNISTTLDQLWAAHYAAAAQPVLVSGGQSNAFSGMMVPSTVKIRPASAPVYEETSFRKLLLESAWLPAEELLDVSDVDSAESLERRAQTFYQPKFLYQKNERTEALLAQHGRYLRPDFESEDFVHTLGIRTNVSMPSLLEHLKEWSARPAFRTTIAHMTKVYQALLYDPDDSTLEFFSNEACIFVPATKGLPAKPTTEAKGVFVRVQDCAWSDQSRVMDRAGVRILALHYGSVSRLDKLLGQRIGMRPEPRLEDYVDAMATLVQQAHESAVDDIAAILKAVSVQWQTATAEGYMQITNQATGEYVHRSKAIFPSFSSGVDGPVEFVKLGQLCINDNEPLATMFADARIETLRQRASKIVPNEYLTDGQGEQSLIDLLVTHDRRTDEDQLHRLRQELEAIEDVHFLHRTVHDSLRGTDFLNFLKIPKLSTQVERNVIQGMMFQGTSAAPTVAKMIVFAQRYLHRVTPDVYDQLVKKDIITIVHDLKVLVNEELSVVHTYQRHTREVNEPCQLNPDHKYLFISRACIDEGDYTSISRELAKVFVPETNGEFDKFVQWLASTVDMYTVGGEASAERQMRNFNNGTVAGIPELAEEPLWELPAEVSQELEKRQPAEPEEGSIAGAGAAGGEIEVSASERRAMRLKKLNEERQQQEQSVREQPASWPANQPSLARGGTTGQDGVTAWPSTTNTQATAPSLADASPAPAIVQPPEHLITPDSVAGEVLRQAAAAVGMSPPDSMVDPALQVGGGHGIGGGASGAVPVPLSPEQLAHTVQTSHSAGTGPVSEPGGSNGMRGTRSDAHPSRWLPARDGRRVTANGNVGLAPLNQVLPPPWQHDEPTEWLQHSSALSSPADIEKLVQEKNLPLLDSNADTTEVGRWGERLVSEFFQSTGTLCEWVNAEAESGLPYDIKLNDGAREIFVEVKTTVTADRHVFPISGRELQFSHKRQGSYWIVRVYGGGAQGAVMRKIEGPWALITQGELGLLLVL